MCSLILSLLPTACVRCPVMFCIIRFFSPATSVSYPLSLHDALPICPPVPPGGGRGGRSRPPGHRPPPAGSGWAGRRGSASRPCRGPEQDRKSTRLNSSHVAISYAVFCLKKKKDGRHQH